MGRLVYLVFAVSMTSMFVVYVAAGSERLPGSEVPREVAGEVDAIDAVGSALKIGAAEGPVVSTLGQMVARSDAVVVGEIVGAGEPRVVTGGHPIDRFEIDAVRVRVDDVLVGRLDSLRADGTILLDTLRDVPVDLTIPENEVLLALTSTQGMTEARDPTLQGRYWPVTQQGLLMPGSDGRIAHPLVGGEDANISDSVAYSELVASIKDGSLMVPEVEAW